MIFNHKLKSRDKSTAGFTLLEMIVAISIFSIAVVVVADIFVSALNSQKAAYRVQQVEENVNYIIERMTKEIRVSELITVEPNGSGNCPVNAATKITLKHPDNGVVSYYRQGTQAIREVNNNVTVLNSNTVDITRFKFCINGAGVTDGTQPRITFVVSIKPYGTNSEDYIETTVSLRKIQE